MEMRQLLPTLKYRFVVDGEKIFLAPHPWGYEPVTGLLLPELIGPPGFSTLGLLSAVPRPLTESN